MPPSCERSSCPPWSRSWAGQAGRCPARPRACCGYPPPSRHASQPPHAHPRLPRHPATSATGPGGNTAPLRSEALRDERQAAHAEDRMTAKSTPTPPTEDLFIYVYALIDDAIATKAISIPARPGPAPGCSDAEILAITLVRLLLGRRSEAGFLAEVARDWAHLFPVLPHQSEFNRRARWLWGASELFRAALAPNVPDDDCQQVDTSALPVKHTSRAPRPTPGPGRMACMPGSAGTPPTPSGFTASGWRSRRTWVPGSCGPGAS